MIEIILGSSSSKRKEIFSFFSLPFQIIPSNFDEFSVPFQGDPFVYAQKITEGKNKILSEKYSNQLILTADSVVFCDNQIFNKPETIEEAKSMLSFFSGKWLSVITAIQMDCKGKTYKESCETKLLFHCLTKEHIEKYHSSFEWHSKSGGFTIERAGNLIIDRIEGDYYNVLGLPLHPLAKGLAYFGINIWDSIN